MSLTQDEITRSARELVETIAKRHVEIACHQDSNVRGGKDYERSRALFLAAIEAAYPSVPARDVYGAWEPGESVWNAYRHVVKRREDDAWLDTYVTIEDDDTAARAEWVHQQLQDEPGGISARDLWDRTTLTNPWTHQQIRETCEWLVARGFARPDDTPAGMGVQRAYYACRAA